MKPQIRHIYFFTIAIRCAQSLRGQAYHEGHALPVFARLESGRNALEPRERIPRFEQRLLELETERQELDEPAADPGCVVERRGYVLIHRHRLDEPLQ